VLQVEFATIIAKIQHLPLGNTMQQLEHSAKELKWGCCICHRSG